MVIVIAMLATVAMTAGNASPSADAAVGLALPDFTDHPFVDTTYKGWAYTAGTKPTRAWAWSTAGWRETALEQGAPGWAHPWTETWHWYWRAGIWYAVQRKNVVQWSCVTPTEYGLPQAITVRGPIVPTGATSTPVHRYNNLDSATIARIAFGRSVVLECGTVFADASHLTGPCDDGYVCPIWSFQPQSLALVRTSDGARGYVLARDIGIIYA